MRNILFLLLILLLSCGKDSYQPLTEKEALYYIVMRPDQADPEQNYRETRQVLRSYPSLRLTRLYTGKQNEVWLFVVRRFSQFSEGESVVEKLKESVDLPPGEVKLMSQLKYRELLKSQAFDAVER